MDVFNFLDPKLTPKVVCSSQFTDNFEPTNLISANPLLKSQGCMAYATVKPPIDIDFELICPIYVHHIQVETTVGSQKTTALEILVKNSNNSYYSVGKAYFDAAGVTFLNSKLYAMGAPPPNAQGFHQCFLRTDRFHPIANVSGVRLRIIQTARSVPCLKRVEVWGNVSRSSPRSLVNTVKELVCPPSPPPPPQQHFKTGTSAARCDEWDVPNELKDALTFEIMTVPITLPSGNTIDQTTLDKCVANEAAYGRHPSDPFTGVQFTSKQKPLFNAALKSRIDLFVTLNSHRPETFNLRRTLGRSKGLKRPAEIPEVHSKRATLEHEAVQYSADVHLQKAIENVTSRGDFVKYTCDPSETHYDIGPKKCTLCLNDKLLYNLTCNHIYCRTCLLDLCKSYICKMCDNKFKTSDIKKLNV